MDIQNFSFFGYRRKYKLGACEIYFGTENAGVYFGKSNPACKQDKIKQTLIKERDLLYTKSKVTDCQTIEQLKMLERDKETLNRIADIVSKQNRTLTRVTGSTPPWMKPNEN